MKISNNYDGFSKLFDEVTNDIKYNVWHKWINEVWSQNGLEPASLLDFACGTGRNSVKFVEQGLKVYGVDYSIEMLKEALKKDSDATFIHGHFLYFEIPKKVDAAICLDFSTNYILSSNEFVDFLNNIYEHLNEGGIFIFDFKPPKAFKSKEMNVDNKNFSYKWSCDDSKLPFVTIDINIELKKIKDAKNKFKERHVERGYTMQEINDIIEATDFDLIGVYDNCKIKKIDDNSDLIQVVLRK